MVFMLLENPWQEDNFQFANLPFERGEIPFSKGFFICKNISRLLPNTKSGI